MGYSAFNGFGKKEIGHADFFEELSYPTISKV